MDHNPVVPIEVDRPENSTLVSGNPWSEAQARDPVHMGDFGTCCRGYMEGEGMVVGKVQGVDGNYSLNSLPSSLDPDQGMCGWYEADNVVHLQRCCEDTEGRFDLDGHCALPLIVNC